MSIRVSKTRAGISPSLRFKVLQRDNFRCRYCGVGAEEEQLEVDHVFPRALGGPSTEGNLVTTCRACNIGKGDRGWEALITLMETFVKIQKIQGGCYMHLNGFVLLDDWPLAPLRWALNELEKRGRLYVLCPHWIFIPGFRVGVKPKDNDCFDCRMGRPVRDNDVDMLEFWRFIQQHPYVREPQKCIRELIAYWA